jgi:transposase
MSNYKYDPILKQQVLDAIKYQGLTTRQAADQFGLKIKTVYEWVASAGTTKITDSTGQTRNKSDILLISQLQQENKELKELLGSTHLDLSKAKKKF